MAVHKRLLQLGRKSGICFSTLRLSKGAAYLETDATSTKYYGSLCSRSSVNRFDYRILYSLPLVRSLEAQGVPSKQANAKAITGPLTKNVCHSFVSKAEMQKTEIVQESNLSKSKSEVQSSQDHHFENLRNRTEKMHSELRYDFDILKCSIRDELAKQTEEFTNLTNKLDKLDRELDKLSADFVAVKSRVFWISILVLLDYINSHL